MAANILFNWGDAAAPKNEFMKGFMAPMLGGQELNMNRQNILSQQLQNQKNAALMKYLEPQAQQGLAKGGLENQMLQQEVQNYPELFGLKKAQAETDAARAANETLRANQSGQRLLFEQQNPLLGRPGIAGQLASYNLAKQMGDPNAELILTDANKKVANSYAFKSLTADDRAAVIGQARALGYDPVEAAQMFASGLTLQDIADAKGVSPQKLGGLEPAYPATGAMRTEAQKRDAMSAESRFLSRESEKMTGGYENGALLASMPVGLLVDKLKGENFDKRTDYLAGVALTIDAAALQSMGSLGLRGIKALEHLEEGGYVKQLSSYKSLLSGKEYQAVRQKIADVLDESNQVYQAHARGLSRHKTKEEEAQTKSMDFSKMSDAELMKMAEEEGL